MGIALLRPPAALRVAIAFGIAVFPSAARADLAVRVPAEATPDEAAAIESALHKAQGAAVRVLVAPPAAPQIPGPPLPATAALERARKAYKSLDMDTARSELAAAEAACLEGGGCGACLELLFDAHLLLGAIAASLEQDDVAAAEFVTAHAALPSRVVDPRRFPPKIVGAFNRACADAERQAPLAVRLAAEPADASLWVNGSSIRAGADVPVRSRRVYVEARLVGHAPRCEAVEAAAAPTSAHTIRLARIAAEAEPGEVERVLSRAAALDGPAVAFLGRVGIDRFVAVALAAAPSRFSVRAAHAGAPAWVDLPPLRSAADAASPQFAEALAAAVGEEPESVPAPAPATPPIPPDEEPDGLDDESEDDTLLLDPDAATAPDAGPSTGSKILRSPWLWISLGVVVAVVGGVVIGTQVND
jgi:hypothetical protein